MSPRRVSGTLVVVGVLGAAFASQASAATKTVYAGPNIRLPEALEFNDFYRRTVTIRQGDSVRWQFRGFHNVTFPARGQRPPPLFASDPSTPIQGVVDAAGAPFFFNGRPRQIIDPRSGLPQGGRSHNPSRLTGSGVPQGETARPYTLRFTRLGSFGYVCTVHPGMRGRVRVVSRRARIPTRAQDLAAAKAQRTAQQRLARRLARPDVPSGQVLGGSDRSPVAHLKFFPSRLTVDAGDSVTLRVPGRQEPHTFSFGPTAYLRDIARNFVAPVMNPSGPPTLVLDPRGVFPSDPPPLPPLSPGIHGNGFLSTGILLRGTPGGTTASIRFSTPGSYGYICFIHPNMRATIVVQ
jgi:plastocyanin